MDSIVYIKVLEDSLTKKLDVLSNILELTQRQETLLRAESFDEEAFRNILEKKQVFIEKLNEIDNGFDTIFKRVKVEIETNKEKYRMNIERLQKLITTITALGVDVEALERRNKVEMEKVLEGKKEEIRANRLGNQGVAHYYNQMNNVVMNHSSFLDQKK